MYLFGFNTHTHAHNCCNCTFISLLLTPFTAERAEQVAYLEMATESMRGCHKQDPLVQLALVEGSSCGGGCELLL